MTVMVIPVSQHKLIKIRKHNRDKLTRAALYCSTAGALCNVLGSSTNSWISTSEVLKYYMAPNATEYLKDYDAFGNQPVYIKEATLGPWQFCWSDPSIEFTCHAVNYFTDEMESDVTTMVQQAVRKAAFFMVLGVVLDILGTLIGWLCSRRKNPYGWLLCSSILHIFAGMTNFCCIIVYMAAVSKEVGNKIYPASEMDDPLFHYHYGFSFILVKLSFLLTETAALLMVVVFMAKRDERTFHRYKMRSLMNFKKITPEGDLKTEVPESTSGHGHARFNSRNRSSVMGQNQNRPSLDNIYQPPSRLSVCSNFGRLTPRSSTASMRAISRRTSKGGPGRFVHHRAPSPQFLDIEEIRRREVDDELAQVVIL